MRMMIVLIIAGVASIASVGCASRARHARQEHGTPGTSMPPTELKTVNLFRQALADEFTPAREVVVSYVEIPPNMRMDRHWHPGEEFHYYLAGKVKIAIDGHPSIIGTPGAVGHVPYRAVHTAITGAEGARILVFRVHTEGEPVRILEEEAAAER